MKYNQETYQVIRQRMLDNMSNDIDKREGSFVSNMVSPVGTEFAKYYMELDNILAIMFLEDATNEFLDKKVNDFAVYRKLGTNATGTIQVEGTVGTYIPKGTIVLSSGELQYHVLNDTWLNEGINDINVEAIEVGYKYNIIPSSIDKFYKNIEGIESISNKDEFIGGSDEETDQELRERFFEIIRRPATSGNIYHYEQWSKEVDGINQAKVKPLWQGPGTVKVIVSNNNDCVDDEVLQNCIEHIEKVRPIGAEVTIITPSVLDIEISANIEVKEDYDAENIKIEIYENINNYLLECEDEVTYTKIASCVGKVEGIEDYNSLLVNNSINNIVFNDEQIPKLKTLLLNEVN